ncbi:MAG: hypothetical protein ABFS38_02590 [Bacteroidota bacterium]
MKRLLKWGFICIGLIVGGLVFFAFARSWNKTELEFLIHINEELVQQSVFGESPTYAIWLEDPGKGTTYTVYATRRVATGDWEGKRDVPGALPVWSMINQAELFNRSGEAKDVHDELAITGATPMPGYFRTRVGVKPGSKWICWIEVNLAGDYNNAYPEYNPVNHQQDEYGIGQPALLYKVEVEVQKGRIVVPEVSGMCVFDEENQVVVVPLQGITTASEVFDEISIAVVRPKPRIIQKPVIKIL